MKKLLFLLILLCLENSLHAQYIYTIKADSVKITNSCDTAELIIENHTQTVPGFLFNKGKGRTEFRKVLQKESDTFYMIGGDPLRIPNAWIQGGNRFGATGIFGTLDNNHIDFYTNSSLQGRWTNTGNMLLGTTDDIGYKLNVNGKLRAGTNSIIGAPDIASIANNTQSLTLYGNFQVVTGVTEGQYGGFSINQNAWGRPGATAMTLNNVAVVGYDGRMYFGGPNAQYFSVFTSGYNGISGGPVSRTKYTLGNDSDPAGWNDSYASFGVSSETEFRTISGYPSGTNYYYLETQLNSPVVSANTGQVGVRAPLKLGARQLWFYTGDYKPGTEAARITETGNVLIGSTTDNGYRLQVAGNTKLEGALVTTGTVRFGGLTNNNSLTRILASDANGNLYYKEDSSFGAFNGSINSDLAVNGRVSAQKMVITQTGRWPDYVFSKQYQLLSLTEVENFINQNSHLPGIPSAAEVEKKGIDVANNQAAFLKKIEELTLYIIEQEKTIQKQNDQFKELKQEMAELKALIKNTNQP
jgi:hypothetical protein